MSGRRWNVEKYRSPHESEEHWNLKRDFMLAHMDRIEEERLVCLAQVYFNMELLGCRYPAETMKEVNELAKEIGMSYKQKKKNMLKRTFVPASDAAEAKVRGTGAKQPAFTPQNGPHISFNMEKAKPSAPAKNNLPLSQKPIAFVKGTTVPSKDLDQPTNSTSRIIEPSRSTSLHTEPPRSLLHKDSPAKSIPSPVPPAKSVPSQFSPAKSIPSQVSPAKSMPSEVPSAEAMPSQVPSAEFIPPQVPPGNHFICNPAIDEYLRKWDNPDEPSGFLLGPIDPSATTDKMKKVVGTQTEHSGIQTTWPPPDTAVNIPKQPTTTFHQRMWGPKSGTSQNITLDNIDMQKYAADLMDNDDPMSNFVITTRDYADCTPSTVITESSRFCKIPIRYDFATEGDYVRCTLYIGQILTAHGTDIVKKNAKHAASEAALNQLRQKCWTIKALRNLRITDKQMHAELQRSWQETLWVTFHLKANIPKKKRVGNEEWTFRLWPPKHEGGEVRCDVLKLHASKSEISVEDVWKNTIPDSNQLGDNNIGNKMLKMMGWTGGGLGKDGTGISEPIRPEQVIGRKCLGAKKTPVNFARQIDELIFNCMKNPNTTDLAFSPEFTKEQRAEIHRIARKHRLTSHSHGTGPNRFLVLSRKYSPKELIYKLLQEGGKHEKYVLIPPGGTEPL